VAQFIVTVRAARHYSATVEVEAGDKYEAMVQAAYEDPGDLTWAEGDFRVDRDDIDVEELTAAAV